MHIMIVGAAGMIGSKLATLIAAEHPSDLSLTLVDIVAPTPPAGASFKVKTIEADISTSQTATRLAALKPDVIYHLAAVVSGEAERDFPKGYDANLAASWKLLDALRIAGVCPRFIFSSSLAVYGQPFPDVVPEDNILRPASSYGTQKAMVEALLTDYTRKGYVDGLSLRLPTIVVRPGAPNAAASSFLSSIIREPLAGKPAILPIDESAAVWISSPNAAVANLYRAATLSKEALNGVTALNLPGITITIRGMIDALKTTAGNDTANLITRQPDALVAQIVQSWPAAFVTNTAESLGFGRDASFQAIIEQYVAEHGGTR